MIYRKNLDLTYLFIAHRLNIVKYISNRLGLMYLGSLIKITEVNQLYSSPLPQYIQALLSAIPVPNPDKKEVESY